MGIFDKLKKRESARAPEDDRERIAAERRSRAELDKAIEDLCAALEIPRRDFYRFSQEFSFLGASPLDAKINRQIADLMVEKIRQAARDERIFRAKERYAVEQAAQAKIDAARETLEKVFDRLTAGLVEGTQDAAARCKLIAVLDMFSVEIEPKRHLSIQSELCDGRELVPAEARGLLRGFQRDDLLYHAEVLSEIIEHIRGKFPSAKFSGKRLREFIEGNRPKPTQKGE